MSQNLTRAAKDLAKKGIQISCAKLGTTTLLQGKCSLTVMKRKLKELCPKERMNISKISYYRAALWGYCRFKHKNVPIVNYVSPNLQSCEFRSVFQRDCWCTWRLHLYISPSMKVLIEEIIPHSNAKKSLLIVMKTYYDCAVVQNCVIQVEACHHVNRFLCVLGCLNRINSLRLHCTTLVELQCSVDKNTIEITDKGICC